MRDLWIDTTKFKDFTVTTADGEVGRIKDFFFDDSDGLVRYIVVNTEHFLFRNLVLVSPMAISSVDTEAGVLNLTITKSQLEKSPPHTSVDTLTRLLEKAYNEHFAWPNYWDSIHGPWVMGPFGVGWRSYEGQLPPAVDKEKSADYLAQMDKCHLRELSELLKYGIESGSKHFGHIHGAVINLRIFKIEYWEIDTVSFVPSKHVLLPIDQVISYRWKDRMVEIKVAKDELREAPAYHRSANGEVAVETLKLINRYYESSGDRAA